MKSKIVVVILLFAFIFFGPSYGETEKFGLLRALLHRADNMESLQKLGKLALENPILLEEILFLENFRLVDSYDKLGAFGFLRLAAHQKKITHEHFFEITNKLIFNWSKYFPPDTEDAKGFLLGYFNHYGFDTFRKIDFLSGVENMKCFKSFLREFGKNSADKFEKDLLEMGNLIDDAIQAKNTQNSLVKLESLRTLIQKTKMAAESPLARETLSAYCNNLIAQARFHAGLKD
jgi:hypothetical protein